ncbi:alanine racemase [Bifidobacterium asteroides]|uniref:alanine racemase n=1 Tax=Bifidobacterium asteroides TaxID=1684 RepID=UPI000D78B5ED|nr:alanine racemase [Bifidobacterium asteroides]PXY87282.1 alanine racemase [Bifidobacterium asteroides]
MTLSAAPAWRFSGPEGQRHYEQALRAYPGQIIVDLRTLKANMATLVNLVHSTNPGAAVMSVVKADAYGHGLIPASLAALAGGATWLGTAQPSEALRLRRAGIGPDRCRILSWMFNGDRAPFDQLIQADIDLGIGSLKAMNMAAQAADQVGRPARVHIKVDTGFGRNGFTPETFGDALRELSSLAARGLLEPVGLFSHLAVADMPGVDEFVSSTDEQIALFEEFSDRMTAAGMKPAIRHLANTAATLSRPGIRYDLTRPGIGLYGYEPDPSMGVSADYGLRPAMTLQAQLGTVKDMPAGHGISYGRTYLTEKPTSTAIMPLGYADGIHRSASGFDRQGAMGREHLGGPVRLMTRQGPKLVRVAGRVCMDQCVLDLEGMASDLGVSEGDTVVLFGPGRGEAQAEPTADDWARAADTISYEIFTCLRGRIPRLYLGVHEVVDPSDLHLIAPESIL